MNRAAATLLAGGLVAAGAGAILLSGDEPADQAKTYQGWALTDCARAKADDKSAAVACESGAVVVPVKWTGERPDGYELIGTPTEIAKETLAKPVPLPLVSDCIRGLVSRDTSEKADGSQWRRWSEPHTCCGPRCVCDDPPCATVPPHELAGRETGHARLVERRPDLRQGEAARETLR